MILPANSIAVAHPGKQHSYQVALAFQQAGLLRRFITGIYFKPEEFPYNMVRWLPRRFRERALRELSKRRLAELDDRLITTIPFFEVASRTVGRAPLLMRLSGGQSSYLFANWAGDWYVSQWLRCCSPRPAALYCFLGSALRSFRQAKHLGVLTVLDVPITLNAPSIIADEKRRLGMPGGSSGLATRLRAEVRTADYIIAPSQAVAESVIAQGVRSERVCIVPFGVDVERFHPASPRTLPGEKRFRVIFVGKMDLRKGMHHLLEAWRQLALPRSELMMVGPPVDADFVGAMRTRYAGLFIERGNVPHAELASLFAGADVFAFPSLAEGSALVTYEALASGLPCVVTHEAGSVVRDGIEGFVVPVGDVQALKDRLLCLYQNCALRHQMAAAARQRAEEFTWQHYHARLVNALDRMVASGPLATEIALESPTR